MAACYPTDPVIDLVGEGFGSPLAHCTARRLSLENRQITILGTNDDPVGDYQQRADNFGQTVLRSEFESHILGPDCPTFAQVDAYSHKSAKPLWRTRSGLVGRASRPDWPDAVLSPTPGAARIG